MSKAMTHETPPQPEPLRQRWFHVGRPWSDIAGLIYAGSEDPHVGTYILSVGDWADETSFGNVQDLDVAALADHIVAAHNATLDAARLPVSGESEGLDADTLRVAWANTEAEFGPTYGGFFEVMAQEYNRLATLDAARSEHPDLRAAAERALAADNALESYYERVGSEARETGADISDLDDEYQRKVERDDAFAALHAALTPSSEARTEPMKRPDEMTPEDWADKDERP